jgi:hypothetical protein
MRPSPRSSLAPPPARPARVALFTAAPLVGSLTLLAAREARAQSSADPSTLTSASGVPDDLPRLILDTGRTAVSEPEPDLVRLQIHGEYQLRYVHVRSFPLDVSESVQVAHPSAIADSTGQHDYAWHWLRITPRLQIRDNVTVVAQMDVVTGLIVGDLAHDTFADETPRDSYDAFSNVQPRWLYLDWLTKYGLWRIGQQPNHWGMGIVANDGDHPSLFGDYRYGAISDGILFATKPLGKEGPLTVAAAGQVVFRDNLARITRGDRAVQGVLAGYWERGPNQLGLYAVYRHQATDRTSASDLAAFDDAIDAAVVDVAGHFAAPVAGTDAFLYGAGEVAAIFGTTNAERTLDQSLTGNRTKVASYGGAAQIGVVHRAHGAPPEDAKGRPVDWGDIAAQIEIGYASGDADPTDGTEKRFVFDPNHKVGLLLFDEVLRFQTARAASAAQDPLLANRPPAGVQLLPSNGGIFGAEYVNPTAIVRPHPWLDLKAGLVIAQTTADVVDPLRFVTKGAAENYRGGDPHRHDLGVEVDLGTEARIPLDYKMHLMLGAQGGLLFPGSALADVNGARMPAPWLVVGRVGLLF